MRYQIQQNQNFVGNVEFLQGEIFFQECGEDFEAFMKSALQEGITRLDDHHSENGESVLVEVLTDKNDPLFELACIEWLCRKGYIAIAHHPEIDEDIRKMIALIRDNEGLKNRILRELPKMTYAEKTFFIDYLDQAKKSSKLNPDMRI
jgi:hypothetical protein